MLPIQVLLVAMGAINSIVDGAVAGRFISAETVGVIGLFYTMVQVISAVNSVLLGGTAVLCGRYMGRGEMQKTRGVFSLNLTVSLLIGLLLTAVYFCDALYFFTDHIVSIGEKQTTRRNSRGRNEDA